MSRKVYDERYRTKYPDRIKASRDKFNTAHPARVKDSQVKWKKENPDGTKRIKRKHLYGLTTEEYQQFLYTQKSACAICKKVVALQIDHCHTSGRVRGLLCGKCNRAIGLLNDDCQILQNAIEYLQ